MNDLNENAVAHTYGNFLRERELVQDGEVHHKTNTSYIVFTKDSRCLGNFYWKT